MSGNSTYNLANNKAINEWWNTAQAHPYSMAVYFLQGNENKDFCDLYWLTINPDTERNECI